MRKMLWTGGAVSDVIVPKEATKDNVIFYVTNYVTTLLSYDCLLDAAISDVTVPSAAGTSFFDICGGIVRLFP